MSSKFQGRLLSAAGMSLVEVMIALLVFLLVFMAVVQMALIGMEGNVVNALRQEAVSIADRKMNDSKNVNFSSLASETGIINTISLRNISNIQTVTNTVVTTVDSNGNFKQIEVAIYWSFKNKPYSHKIISLVQKHNT